MNNQESSIAVDKLSHACTNVPDKEIQSSASTINAQCCLGSIVKCVVHDFYNDVTCITNDSVSPKRLFIMAFDGIC